jgi:N-methylhydantoinase B
MPDKIPAAYYGMSNVHILSGDGHEDGGRGWIFFDIEVGGWGARPTSDGPDCYSQGIHNLANTPIEMVEATYPLRYTRYELLADTGGVGEFRGGLGVARDMEFLDETGMLNTQFDKFKIAPFGLFGGGDGACGRLTLKTGGQVVELASKTVNQTLRQGDTISMHTQGGGGFGDPSKRDPEKVRRDLRQGKITAQRAARYHGVNSEE